MRIDNTTEEVIKFYNLYVDPDDPGMTEPIDLCDSCAVGWADYLFVDSPDDQETFCFECGQKILED